MEWTSRKKKKAVAWIKTGQVTENVMGAHHPFHSFHIHEFFSQIFSIIQINWWFWRTDDGILWRGKKVSEMQNTTCYGMAVESLMVRDEAVWWY